MYYMYVGIDINSTELNLTILSGETSIKINTSYIIVVDDVNEAEEVFILLLEITDAGEVQILFDNQAGILIYTIKDSNSKGCNSQNHRIVILWFFTDMILVLNVSGNTTFDESQGDIDSVITVQKQDPLLRTEVNISITVVITGAGTAFAGIKIFFCAKIMIGFYYTYR